MMTDDKTEEVWEKINATVSCMIQSPMVFFDCKVDLFNLHAKRMLETQDWEGNDMPRISEDQIQHTCNLNHFKDTQIW